MKQTIYVDILLGVNLFINYFTLLGTSRFLYIKYKRIRIFLGSLLGSFYSLYIFFPKLNFAVSLIIKLLMVVTIIIVAFGTESKKVQIKAMLSFWGINVAFSGIMFALWCLYSPKGLVINNSVVYFNISPLVLLTSTVIAYAILDLGSRVIEKKAIKDILCKVGIEFGGKKVVVEGKVDTCNSLREPFSNLPVIVVRKDKILNAIPKEISDVLDFNDTVCLDGDLTEKWRKNFRMVPFRTVSGDGVLPAFKPDNIEIERGKNKYFKNAYVAICKDNAIGGDVSALVSPELVD